MQFLTTFFQLWHCDHFGHVNTRIHAAAFDDGIVPVTAEMKTAFRAEAHSGIVTKVTAQVLRIGGKSVTFRLHRAARGQVLSSCEVVEVFFDPITRTSAPIPEALRARLAA